MRQANFYDSRSKLRNTHRTQPPCISATSADNKLFKIPLKKTRSQNSEISNLIISDRDFPPHFGKEPGALGIGKMSTIVT